MSYDRGVHQLFKLASSKNATVANLRVAMEGRRLLVPFVKKTLLGLGIRGCGSVHGAHPQGEIARIKDG